MYDPEKELDDIKYMLTELCVTKLIEEHLEPSDKPDNDLKERTIKYLLNDPYTFKTVAEFAKAIVEHKIKKNEMTTAFVKGLLKHVDEKEEGSYAVLYIGKLLQAK